MRSPIERQRHLFEHEVWAHDRVLASIESVPDPSRHDPDFHWALDRMAHIMIARMLWLARLKGEEAPADLFPHIDSLEGLRTLSERVRASWRNYLSELDDDALSRTVSYQSSEGQAFETPVEDILDQVYTHGFYHRGQIARAISAAGGERAVQDLIFYVRSETEMD